jgi:hypothetical protein
MIMFKLKKGGGPEQFEYTLQGMTNFKQTESNERQDQNKEDRIQERNAGCPLGYQMTVLHRPPAYDARGLVTEVSGAPEVSSFNLSA